MTIVARRARRLSDQVQVSVESDPKDLREFRDLRAWVLLGEPGAGKSESLRSEAGETGGVYLRIAEFIHADRDDDWNGKPLFLDGLDETRASPGSDSTIQLICRQLKRLGAPPFRIACRAADWYGASDAKDLDAVVTDDTLAVLQLDPLADEDIVTILRENHGQDDPHAFMDQAGRLGIGPLLSNPETLGLLAKAVRDDEWPATRDDTYRLACEKLAQETNKCHRDQARMQSCSIEQIRDAAGQLCAVLLLSNHIGIALDYDRCSSQFVDLKDCDPPELRAAAMAVHTSLFRPDGEERVVPTHRSVAEFLAARWLASQIKGTGLPLGRVLNLMLGPDGRTIAGLRGLYAWLALHSLKARQRLIAADPLTVVIYGDVRPMTVADKRELLSGLRREADRYSGFRWEIRTDYPFGGLADPALTDDFLVALRAPERDDAHQAFVDCVIDILTVGEATADLDLGLAPTLRELVCDSSRWPGIRHGALGVWLTLIEPPVALALLNDITAGRVPDQQHELAGTLLWHLYPRSIEVGALFRYLHIPADGRLVGSYSWFWSHELPRCAPDADVAELLDGLVNNTEIHASFDHGAPLHGLVDKLLIRGITAHAETISDQRLFDWLGIGADELGAVRREQRAQTVVSDWLRTHPDRYKALLSLCFTVCAGQEHLDYCVYSQSSRLKGVLPPDDLGLWHLNQAKRMATSEMAQLHLKKAIDAFVSEQGASGLSLESITEWASDHPERRHWLESLLVCEIPEWRARHSSIQRNREQERAGNKRKRTIALQAELPKIQAGTASDHLMYQLAGVWMNLYADIQGETPAARFEYYADNGHLLLAKAEAGFRRCLEREDLPTVKEIIDLAINQQEHYVRRPCLVGMKLSWRDGKAAIDRLPEQTLRRTLAFCMTDGTDTPDWFIHLLRCRPALVAEVLILYASKTLKAGKDFVNEISPLEHNSEYRELAIAAVPILLQAFPLRARSGQLHYLKNLLKAALRDTPEKLPPLIETKLSKKSLDRAQKVYWLASGMLLNPERYEALLWAHIGKSEVRANQLSGFLSERYGGFSGDSALPASTIGKLIERLEPHAVIDKPTGGVYEVTTAMRRGDDIRALINCLGNLATAEAERQIERLLGLATLHELKPSLEAARHQLRQRQREQQFHFVGAKEVARVLANQAPVGIADLAALTLAHLDDVALEIRRENTDGFRAFWNIENRKPVSQREENPCRDSLLTRIRACLERLDIDSQPEGDYANDKRADIRVSYRAKLDLPIEIKRDSNSSLWTALRQQLIDQYAIAPGAQGFGIYLVLWFGGDGMPRATDGGKKPRSPAELRTRLEAQLKPIERQRIFVRVLDVSWPDEVKK